MYTWVNRFRWYSVWKWALQCWGWEVESSERVGGLTNFPLWKIVQFHLQGIQNMKQLAFFMNPSPLSWKIISSFQCESPYFRGWWCFYLNPGHLYRVGVVLSPSGFGSQKVLVICISAREGPCWRLLSLVTQVHDRTVIIRFKSCHSMIMQSR